MALGNLLANISVLRFPRRSHDWTNAETAEFYRVEAALIRSGVKVDTGRGLSDEGHPWFVFCRADTGDVILHMARIDGHYLVASPAMGGCARGPHFRSLIDALLASYATTVAQAKSPNVFTHPSAALIVLVGFFYFKLQGGVASATEADRTAAPAHSSRLLASTEPAVLDGAAAVDGPDEAGMLTAIGAALAYLGEDAVATAYSTSIQLPDDTPQSAGFCALHAPKAQFDAIAGSSAPTGVSAAVDFGTNSIANSWQADRTTNHSLTLGHAAITGPGVAEPGVDVSAFFSATSRVVSQNAQSGLPPVDHPVSLVFEVQHASPNSAASQSSLLAFTSSIVAMNSSDAGQEVINVVKDALGMHLYSSLADIHKEFLTGMISEQPGQDNLSPNSATSTAATPSTAPSGGANTSSTAPSGGATTSSAAPSGGATSGSSSAVPSNSIASGDTHVSASSSESLSAQEAAATSTIISFEQSHPDFQVVDIGKEVLICDPNLTSSNYSSAIHETISFSDGSSILLVGLPAHHQTASVLS